MKILIVGSASPWALEQSYAAAFRQMGHEVAIVPVVDRALALARKNPAMRLMTRLAWQRLWRPLGRAMVEEARRWQPDVVWVFRGMEVAPEHLEAVRQPGRLLVNFNPDHPFRYGPATGNEWIVRSLPLYDLHFAWHREVVARLQRQGLDVVYLPFGYDDLHWLAPLPASAEAEVPRIAFAGTLDTRRHALIGTLARAGLPVDVFAERRPGHPAHPNIRYLPPVYGAEYARVATRYRVALNIFRPWNEGAHNMRSFELAAAGAVQLAPDSPDHRAWFRPETSIFLYRSAEEAAAFAERLLHLPKGDALHIRHEARNDCLRGGHHYRWRARRVCEELSARRS